MEGCVEGVRNPFSATRFAPDRGDFLFPAGQSAAGLLERLCTAGWRGQIVGPHGSGKSTLLAALLAAAGLSGRRSLAVALRDGQRRLPREFLTAARSGPIDLLAVDGYEQLGRWHRFLLGRLCRRRRLGLVVTSHRPLGLPELFRTAVDPALAWHVVQRLQAGFPPLVTFADVTDRLAEHGGDLRETLFDLYDLFARRRGP
jgi:hypothetical protein